MEAAGVLSSTFALGILLHAAQSSFYATLRGHVRTLPLYRRRVLLLSFLLTVSLYALGQFVVLLLLEDTPCQVAVVFSTIFDQLSRVLAFAFVAGKITEETHHKFEKVGLYGAILLRFLLGAVIVGFTRIQFIPVCFASPQVIAPNYVQIGYDGLLIIYFILRIPGMFRLFVDSGAAKMKPKDQKTQGFGLFLISLAYFGWYIASLGMSINQWSIFVRIVPLSLALTIVLAVLRLFPSLAYATASKKSDIGTYGMRRLDSTSPAVAATTGARLSPSQSPTDGMARPNDLESNNPRKSPFGLRSATTPGASFRSIVGAPITPSVALNVHPGDPLPWGQDGTLKSSNDGTLRTRSSRYLSDLSRASVALVKETLFPAHAGGKSEISGPITAGQVATGLPSSVKPGRGAFPQIKTVSLAEAAQAQRQRNLEEQQRAERERNDPKPPQSSGIPADVDVRTMEKSMSVKRKAIERSESNASTLPSRPTSRQEPSNFYARENRISEASMESGQHPSRIPENRFSEYTSATEYTNSSSRNSQMFPSALQPAPPPPVQQYQFPVPPQDAKRNSMNDNTIMFINSIEYDNPALVSSILHGSEDFGVSPSKASGFSAPPRRSVRNSVVTRRSPLSSRLTVLPVLNERSENSSPASIRKAPPTPVMERKRPKRATVDGRALFPYEPFTPPKRSTNRKSKMKSMSSIPPQLPPPTIPLPLPPIPICTEEDMKEAEKTESNVNLDRASIGDFPEPPSTLPVIKIQRTASKSKRESTLRESRVPSIVVDDDSRRHSGSDSDEAYATAKAWIARIAGKDFSQVKEVELHKGMHFPQSKLAPIPSARSSFVSNYSGKSLHTPEVSESPEMTFVEQSDSEIELTASEAGDMTESDGQDYSDSEVGSYNESDSDYANNTDVMIEQQFEFYEPSDIEVEMVEERRAAPQPILRSPIDIGPRHFRLGDRIPTFYESRSKYGTRRKPPPSPIGFLMRRRRLSRTLAPESRQTLQVNNAAIDQRLTLLATKQQKANGVEDLLARIQPPSKRRETMMSFKSDTSAQRNSLLAKLEAEMEEQEDNWMDLQQRVSMTSSITDRSANQVDSTRTSLIFQRASTLLKTLAEEDASVGNSIPSESTNVTRASWQKRISRAQADYGQNAQATKDVRTDSVQLSSQGGDYSSFTTPSVASVQPQNGIYLNTNINMFFEGAPAEVSYLEVSPTGTEFEEDNEEDEAQGFPVMMQEGSEIMSETDEEEEYISPLPATVYNPNVFQEVLSVVSRSPYSEPSPFSTAAPSFLWNPLPVKLVYEQTGFLWNWHAPVTPVLSEPPAISIRPKQRKTEAPLTITSTRLWVKAKKQNAMVGNGLWKNPRGNRPKSILITKTDSRRKSKKVVFSPEVYSPVSGQSSSISQLRSLVKKSILASPDPSEIAVYEEKPLPPIPVFEQPQNVSVPIAEPSTTTNDPIESAVSAAMNLLWAPRHNFDGIWNQGEVPVAAPEKLWKSTKALSELGIQTDFGVPKRRAYVQQPALEIQSSNLWVVINKEKHMPTLWRPTKKGLWPLGAETSTVGSNKVGHGMWEPTGTTTAARKNLNIVFEKNEKNYNGGVRAAKKVSTVEGSLWSLKTSVTVERDWLSETVAHIAPSIAVEAGPKTMSLGSLWQLPTISSVPQQVGGLWNPTVRVIQDDASFGTEMRVNTLRRIRSDYSALPSVSGTTWVPTRSHRATLWLPSRTGLWNLSNDTPSLEEIAQRSGRRDLLWSEYGGETMFQSLTMESMKSARKLSEGDLPVFDGLMWGGLGLAQRTVDGDTATTENMEAVKTEFPVCTLWQQPQPLTQTISSDGLWCAPTQMLIREEFFMDIQLDTLRRIRNDFSPLPTVSGNTWRLESEEKPSLWLPSETGLWNLSNDCLTLEEIALRSWKQGMLWSRYGGRSIFEGLSFQSLKSSRQIQDIELPLFTGKLWEGLRLSQEEKITTPVETAKTVEVERRSEPENHSTNKKLWAPAFRRPIAAHKDGQLWSPVESAPIFDSISYELFKPSRQVVLGPLTISSGKLWNATIDSETSLWKKTTQVYGLWRHELSAFDKAVNYGIWKSVSSVNYESGVKAPRSRITDVELASLTSNSLWNNESTGEATLWKKDVHVFGLWKNEIKGFETNVNYGIWNAVSASNDQDISIQRARVPDARLTLLASTTLWNGKTETKFPTMWKRPVLLNGLWNSNIKKPMQFSNDGLWLEITSEFDPKMPLSKKRVGSNEPLPVFSGPMWGSQTVDKFEGQLIAPIAETDYAELSEHASTDSGEISEQEKSVFDFADDTSVTSEEGPFSDKYSVEVEEEELDSHTLSEEEPVAVIAQTEMATVKSTTIFSAFDFGFGSGPIGDKQQEQVLEEVEAEGIEIEIKEELDIVPVETIRTTVGLWQPKIIEEISIPVETLLWHITLARRTTELLPEPSKAVIRKDFSEQKPVTGTLWSGVGQEAPCLWKKSERWYTAGARCIPAKSHLWSKQTASRTTELSAEITVSSLSKRRNYSELVYAAGPMWSPVKKEKPSLWTRGERWYTVGAFPLTQETALLWAKHTASRTTTALPINFTCTKKKILEPFSQVSGPMWLGARVAQQEFSLWKRAINTVATSPLPSPTFLWHEKTASRTTSAEGKRSSLIAKPVKRQSIELLSFTGSLWKAEKNQQLWNLAHRLGVPGLWRSVPVAPSDSLWKRRSHLLAPRTLDQTVNKRSSWLPKKVTRPESEVVLAQSQLWTLSFKESAILSSNSSQGGLWGMSPLSPALSSGSTISNTSEVPSATSSFDNHVQIKIADSSSETSSLSSSPTSSGLWKSEMKTNNNLAFHGLWSLDTVSRNRRSVLVAERPQRVTERAVEDELPVFGDEHSLWKPSAIQTEMIDLDLSMAEDCNEYLVEDICPSPCSDSSRFSFMTQDSFMSQYAETEITECSEVCEGKYRDLTDVSHRLMQPIERPTVAQIPGRDSPFATTLRVSSLRKKLRPVIVAGEKKKPTQTNEQNEIYKPKRHVSMSKKPKSETRSTSPKNTKPVLPDNKYLWSKGIA